MSFAFTYGLRKGPEALAAGDIRVAILSSNSNVLEQQNAEFVSGITLDEYDGANYVRKALASEAILLNLTNKTYAIDAANPVWTNLGAGTREGIGFLVLFFVTNDADSVPLFFIEATIVGDGTDLTWTIDPLGIARWISGA